MLFGNWSSVETVPEGVYYCYSNSIADPIPFNRVWTRHYWNTLEAAYRYGCTGHPRGYCPVPSNLPLHNSNPRELIVHFYASHSLHDIHRYTNGHFYRFLGCSFGKDPDGVSYIIVCFTCCSRCRHS